MFFELIRKSEKLELGLNMFMFIQRLSKEPENI